MSPVLIVLGIILLGDLGSAGVKVNSSCCIIYIKQLKNGNFIAVGGDKNLYISPSITSVVWTIVPNSGSVTSIIELEDGSFIGAGTDQQLYTSPSLASPFKWTKVPNNVGNVTSIEII